MISDISNRTVTSSLISKNVLELEEPEWHHIDIAFDAGHFKVFLDSLEYINYLIDDYFGFTAGTGGLINRHLIDNFIRYSINE